MPNPNPEWFKTPDGKDCKWCPPETPDYEPADDIEAEDTLCRGHLAEYLGESLASLDRMEAGERADMDALGYYDT